MSKIQVYEKCNSDNFYLKDDVLMMKVSGGEDIPAPKEFVVLKDTDKWYNAIVKERDERLKLAKEESEKLGIEEAKSFHFITAHGLTETLRIYDRLFKEE